MYKVMLLVILTLSVNVSGSEALENRLAFISNAYLDQMEGFCNVGGSATKLQQVIQKKCIENNAENIQEACKHVEQAEQQSICIASKNGIQDVSDSIIEAVTLTSIDLKAVINRVAVPAAIVFKDGECDYMGSALLDPVAFRANVKLTARYCEGMVSIVEQDGFVVSEDALAGIPVECNERFVGPNKKQICLAGKVRGKTNVKLIIQ